MPPAACRRQSLQLSSPTEHQGNSLTRSPRALGVQHSAHSAVELFAGAGGLALGASLAGVEHLALVESSPSACACLRLNLGRLLKPDSNVVEQSDVSAMSFVPYRDRADLLLAGAPCQPWSFAGRHNGPTDSRNLFCEVVRAQEEIAPQALVIENVRGLTRPAYADFLEFLRLAVSFPAHFDPRSSWLKALRDLRRIARKFSSSAQYLAFGPVSLNAADFGTPQVRHRVFLVAFRADLGAIWTPPQATHSRAELARQLWKTGEYWERHKIVPQGRRSSLWAATRAFAGEHSPFPLKAWRTVRDTIGDLPSFNSDEACQLRHDLVRGARAYPGHTGSHVDWPAKTLKAGVHGVPGGENCLRLSNGRVRYFSVREAARLQDFPDWYVFDSSWSRAFAQIGNAVPVNLASSVVRSVIASISAVEGAGDLNGTNDYGTALVR